MPLHRSAATGEVYSGGWRGDARSGRGTLQWPSGARYRGQWKSGLPHGKGIMLYANGEQGCYERAK
jgi:1-phosphatidylinositol-4-phosphate 5-kinase